MKKCLLFILIVFPLLLIAQIDPNDLISHPSGIVTSWHHEDHSIECAWNKGMTGSGIGIAIIDTGLSGANPYFMDDQLITRYNFLNPSPSTPEEFSGNYDTENWNDIEGHGTKAAGIIGATPNLDGIPTGIAPESSLFIYRAVNLPLFGLTAEKNAVANSIIHAANNPDIHIISMSIGMLPGMSSSLIQNALTYAIGQGKLIFAAAGTYPVNGNYGASVVFPANSEGVHAVTGVRENLDPLVSCGSCFSGAEVEFAVYMERINNTVSTGITSPWLSYFGGSSTATATMSGMAALLWSANPNASRGEIVNQLVRSSSNYSDYDFNDFGWGTVDLCAASNLLKECNSNNDEIAETNIEITNINISSTEGEEIEPLVLRLNDFSYGVLSFGYVNISGHPSEILLSDIPTYLSCPSDTPPIKFNLGSDCLNSPESFGLEVESYSFWDGSNFTECNNSNSTTTNHFLNLEPGIHSFAHMTDSLVIEFTYQVYCESKNPFTELTTTNSCGDVGGSICVKAIPDAIYSWADINGNEIPNEENSSCLLNYPEGKYKLSVEYGECTFTKQIEIVLLCEDDCSSENCIQVSDGNNFNQEDPKDSKDSKDPRYDQPANINLIETAGNEAVGSPSNFYEEGGISSPFSPVISTVSNVPLCVSFNIFHDGGCIFTIEESICTEYATPNIPINKMIIDYGDGTILTFSNINGNTIIPELTHAYTVSGTYTVSIFVSNELYDAKYEQDIVVSCGSVTPDVNLSVFQACQNPENNNPGFIANISLDPNFDFGSMLLQITSQDGNYDISYTNIIYIPGSTGNYSSGFHSLPPGNYQLVLTSEEGTIMQQEFFIDISEYDPILLSIFDFELGECHAEGEGSIKISNAGDITGYMYSWSNGESGTSITNLSAGTYTLTISNSTGCEKTTSFQIESVYDGFYYQSDCDGMNSGVIDLGAPKENHTYLWNNGSNETSITNLSAGTYTVTVTNIELGCSFMEEFILSGAESPNFSVEIMDACNVTENNGSITIINNGDVDYTYLWEDLVTNGNTYQNLSPGEYNVYIFNTISACSYLQTYTVGSSSPNISVNATILDACDEVSNNGSISVQIINGGLFYSYEWSLVENGEIISTAANLTNLSPGSYWLTVTDGNVISDDPECQTVFQYEVEADPGFDFLEENYNACNLALDNGIAGVKPLEGNIPGPYSYNWNTGDITQYIRDILPGNYTVTITNESTTCSLVKNITVGINETPFLINSTITTICGPSAGINANIIGQYADWEWSNGVTTNHTTNSSPFDDNHPITSGTYDVTVTLSHGIACQANASFTLDLDDANKLLGIEETIEPSCGGDDDGSINLNINSEDLPGFATPLSFLWTGPNNFTSISENLDDIYPGTYNLTITTANGCTADYVFVVPVISILSPIIGVTASCVGGANGSITMTFFPGSTIPTDAVWSDRDGVFSVNDIFNPTGLAPGSYGVVYSYNGRCSIKTQITVGSYDASPNDSYEILGNILVTPGNCMGGGVIDINGNTMVWDGAAPDSWNLAEDTFDDSHIYADNLTSGIYTILFYNSEGCQVGSQEIEVPNEDIVIDVLESDILPSCIIDGIDSSNGRVDIFIHSNTGESMIVEFNGEVVTTNNTSEPDFLNTFHYLSAGEYTIEASVGDCSSSVTFEIPEIIPETPIITNIVETPTCINENTGSISFEIVGGQSPLIVDGIYTYQREIEVTGLSAGSYSMLIEERCGETQILEYSILEKGFPEITSEISECGTGWINLTSSNPFETDYEWSDEGLGPFRSSLGWGMHTVTITANECSEVQTFTLTEPLPLNLTLTKEVDPDDSQQFDECVGLRAMIVDINGGVAPYQLEVFEVNPTGDETSILVLNYNEPQSNEIIGHFPLLRYNVRVVDICGTVVSENAVDLCDSPCYFDFNEEDEEIYLYTQYGSPGITIKLRNFCDWGTPKVKLEYNTASLDNDQAYHIQLPLTGDDISDKSLHVVGNFSGESIFSYIPSNCTSQDITVGNNGFRLGRGWDCNWNWNEKYEVPYGPSVIKVWGNGCDTFEIPIHPKNIGDFVGFNTYTRNEDPERADLIDLQGNPMGNTSDHYFGNFNCTGECQPIGEGSWVHGTADCTTSETIEIFTYEPIDELNPCTNGGSFTAYKLVGDNIQVETIDVAPNPNAKTVLGAYTDWGYSWIGRLGHDYNENGFPETCPTNSSDLGTLTSNPPFGCGCIFTVDETFGAEAAAQLSEQSGKPIPTIIASFCPNPLIMLDSDGDGAWDKDDLCPDIQDYVNGTASNPIGTGELTEECECYLNPSPDCEEEVGPGNPDIIIIDDNCAPEDETEVVVQNGCGVSVYDCNDQLIYQYNVMENIRPFYLTGPNTDVTHPDYVFKPQNVRTYCMTSCEKVTNYKWEWLDGVDYLRSRWHPSDGVYDYQDLLNGTLPIENEIECECHAQPTTPPPPSGLDCSGFVNNDNGTQQRLAQVPMPIIRPNPAFDQITIHFLKNENGTFMGKESETVITFHDLLGMKIHEVVRNGDNEFETIMLDGVEFKSGIYIITISTKNQTHSEKLIIVK